MYFLVEEFFLFHEVFYDLFSLLELMIVGGDDGLVLFFENVDFLV